jgi:hypothetical protein
MFQYNGLLMTYTGRRKQLLDNKHLQTVSCVRLGTALYIAVLHQRGCFVHRHILMMRCNHMILLWCWNVLNSNLELELLRRSELTVKWTNAFNRILPVPRSTKYSPFFSLQLQFLCLFYRTFQCCNVIIWSKQTIPLRLATNDLCNFTNLPNTSCILGPNFLTTLVLNTLNLCPSLIMRDQDCNINKWQVKMHITFFNNYVCVQETER